VAMEIDVASSVSGAPSVRQTQGFLRRLERLHRPVGRELSVLFCGDARMRALNRRYRGRDRSTDVLAFPGQGASLGDIVISLPYASREARRRGESRRRELDRLLLHGYLHLNGYDHEVDEGQMDRLEWRLRSRLGLALEARPAAPRARGKRS